MSKTAMDQSSQPSVWNTKPWWCQPWSILLTGCTIIGGSWWGFHRYWLTGIVSLPIVIWMGFFLLVYPRLVTQADGFDHPGGASSGPHTPET
jgi:hypothetical protein